ncbi:MAG: S4 domain-containing protein, partial [Deltaproteobacteria bacterium]|nr:S4 domain-containing protein [Deltaproteobacteria bacterium]
VEEADRAEEGARAVFGGGGSRDDVPSSGIDSARLKDGWPLAELLAEVGLTKSRGEARRLIQQGGVSVNDERVGDAELMVTGEHALAGEIMIRLGKKRFHRLVVEQA